MPMPPLQLIATLTALLFACGPAFVRSADDAQAARAALKGRAPAFTAVALGTAGGLDEGALTSFLLGPPDGSSYVALDAGTLYAGLRTAIRKGSFAGAAPPAGSTLTLAGHLLRERVRVVFVSHSHLDHVAGLIIASPDDAPKPVFALASTHDALGAAVWQSPLWLNFTSEGPSPLGKLQVVRMAPGVALPVPGTPFTAEAWPLSHGALTSTAFLVASGTDHALYLGDTGPDRVEGHGRLAALWTRIAPLVRTGQLRALFLECSFPDPRPEKLLFGHLTPSWLIEELGVLARTVDGARPDEALRSLTLVVTHIKPTLQRGPEPRAVIETQLAPLRSKLRLLLPEAGARYSF